MEVANVYLRSWKPCFYGVDLACAVSVMKYFGFHVEFHDWITDNASAMEEESSYWQINSAITFYPTLVCTHKKNSGNAYLVVL